MRILNVTQSYAPFLEFGGPPEKVRALSEGLAHLGHDVTVLTADWGLDRRLALLPGEPPAGDSPFGRKREVNGVKAIYLPNWLHYHAASWNPALPRYLRARLENFDVVHIFGLYDLLGFQTGAAAAKRGIPYIVEPIGMFVPIVRNVRLKRMYHALFGRQMLLGAAAIIATSEQEKTELIGGGIAARLQRMAEDLHLAGRVHFSGPVSGEAKWGAYVDADIFVLPSQNENFGNTAAESVAAGTPVIVTNQCGIAPLLADVAGLAVNHDADSLAGALLRLLDDRALYQGLKRRCSFALQQLDWETPVREMDSLFQGLAGLAKS